MSNDWNVHLEQKEPPYSRQKALIPAAVWKEHKHLAKVSRSAALRRVQNGWSIFDAITMPPHTKDQSDNIIAFLEKHPLAPREIIADAINKSGSTTLKFLESLEAAGKIYKSVGKTTKNRPIYFYSLANNLTHEPEEAWDIDAERNWKSKPFVNPIRQRALDDLEKLKKMKQK